MLGRRGTVPRALPLLTLPPLTVSNRWGAEPGERREENRERGIPTMEPRSSPRFLNQSPTSRKDSPPDRRGSPSALAPLLPGAGPDSLPAATLLRCICTLTASMIVQPWIDLYQQRAGTP